MSKQHKTQWMLTVRARLLAIDVILIMMIALLCALEHTQHIATHGNACCVVLTIRYDYLVSGINRREAFVYEHAIKTRFNSFLYYMFPQ